MSSHYVSFVPEHAHQAFERWYAYGVDDEKFEAFAGAWGGFEYEHFLRALQYGEGDDHLCAMFAVGASTYQDAASVLLPFLHSEQRDERVVSAIALGIRRDSRAYPFLERLVLECLSLDERQHTFGGNDQKAQEDLFLCDRFRPKAVQLLDTWQSPTLIPTLLQALQALWGLEKRSSQLFAHQEHAYTALLYALGQRGEFTALDTVDFPPMYQKIARVYLALGAIKAEPGPRLKLWVMKHEKQIEHFLEENFQLDAENAYNCIQTFHRKLGSIKGYQATIDKQSMKEGHAVHIDKEMDTSFFESETAETEEEKSEEETIVQTEPALIWSNETHYTETVWSLAWSPDGTHFVSGGEDRTIHILNGQTGRYIRAIRGHTACVTTVTWSPDGQWIASGGCDNKVLVWHARSGAIVTAYTQHTAWICKGLAWSPDGASIASASWDGSVHIWEAMTGKTLVRYREHRGVVTALAWSPDGTHVVSGEGYPDCAIHIWDAFTGQQRLLYRAHMHDTAGTRPIEGASDPEAEAQQRGPSSVRSLAWSPDGKWIASAGLRDVFRVWDAQTGEDLIAKAPSRWAELLAWSPDSSYVATGQHDSIDFWSIAAKKITHTYTLPNHYSLTALAWSPDQKAIATGARKPGISVWKVDIG